MSEKVIFFKINLTGGRSQQQICDRIAEIDTLLDFLFVTAIPGVQQGNIMQYKLDTGQSKVDVVYRGAGEIAKDIERWENLRQRFVNMLVPRMVRLVGSKNFRR